MEVTTDLNIQHHRKVEYNMKHLRTVEIDENKYLLGDVIAFDLIDGEHVEAMAVREEADGMIFCAIDCLRDEYPMQQNGKFKDGYEKSDLRAILNSKIIDRFPADLRQKMIPFANCDLLRIPTEREIFGENEYGVEEPEDVERFECMKDRRNRIAFQGSGTGVWEWYWLQNRSVDSATNACYVSGYGNAGDNSASISFGVRPLFKIQNP